MIMSSGHYFQKQGGILCIPFSLLEVVFILRLFVGSDLNYCRTWKREEEASHPH